MLNKDLVVSYINKEAYEELKKYIARLSPADKDDLFHNFNSDGLFFFFAFKKNLNQSQNEEKEQFLDYVISQTDSLYLEDKECESPAHLLVRHGRLFLLDRIYQKNPYMINYINFNNKSLIDYSVIYAQEKIFDYLLSKNIASNSFGNFALSQDQQTLYCNLNFESDPYIDSIRQKIMRKIHNELQNRLFLQEQKSTGAVH